MWTSRARNVRKASQSKQSSNFFFPVERRKEQLGEAKASAGKKKLDKQEEQLRGHSRDLNMVKMKSVLVIGFTFTALLGMFNTM